MTSAEPIVYLVEDDDVVRDALSLVLRSGGIAASGYPSAEQFLAAYQRSEPCCLILDIRLPGISGLELQQRMLAQDDQIPIIFITGCGDVRQAATAFKSGALDFIEKPVEDGHLLAAVDQAIALARDDAHDREQIAHLREWFKSLTRRERDVMDRIVAGATNKVVANELKISPRTVEIYRRRVMEKMRVRTLADLVRAADLVGLTGSDTHADRRIFGRRPAL